MFNIKDMKMISYLSCIIILIPLIIFLFTFNYKQLNSLKSLYVPLLISLVGFFLAYISIRHKDIPNIKILLDSQALPILIALLGIYYLFLNNRVETLKPIYTASGSIDIRFEPTKLREKGKYCENPYGWVDLWKDKYYYRFLDANNMKTWGNDGLLSSLTFELKLNNYFPIADYPFSDVHKYEFITFSVFMIPRKKKILGGSLLININSNKTLRFNIPEQYLYRFCHIIVPLNETSLDTLSMKLESKIIKKTVGNSPK